MNTRYCLYPLLFILIVGKAISQGLVVNHNCLELVNIPLNWIDSVQSELKWHYAHTSHGGQLTTGLDRIEINDPIYNVSRANSFLPSTTGALCIFDGQEGGTYITPEEYWQTSIGMNKTRDVLNHNPIINISQWCWCTQVNTYSESNVQKYLDSLSVLEAEFPEVTFIYMTGNAQTGPGNHYNQNLDQGYNRYLRNEQIRNYCINNNKILFDFADIDCWWYDSNSEDWEWSTYEYWNGSDTVTVPFEHPHYNLNQAGHTSYENCENKGRAVWWMMAKLTGWNHETNLNLKVFLEGPFNGIDMNTNLNSVAILPLSQPYNTLPWNYMGVETVSIIPNPDIVDWVLVELRDAPNAVSAIPSTIIAQQAAFLKKDGSILDLSGSSNLHFDVTINQGLYVVIRHRNHLDIMSNNSVPYLDGVYTYDFTNGVNQVYGGIDGHKQLQPGVWAIAAGDGNADGYINGSDKVVIWENQAGKAEYLNGDFNLDGQVVNPDKNEFWILNSGNESQVPE